MTRQRAALLRSVPGIGALTAASLLALLPELGRLDGKAVASLAGVAPFARDSGLMKGRRTIWGGRKTGPHRALHGHPGRHAPQPRRSKPSTNACAPAARPRSSRSPPACASSWSSSTPCSPAAHLGEQRSRLDRLKTVADPLSVAPAPITLNPSPSQPLDEAACAGENPAANPTSEAPKVSMANNGSRRIGRRWLDSKIVAKCRTALKTP